MKHYTPEREAEMRALCAGRDDDTASQRLGGYVATQDRRSRGLLMTQRGANWSEIRGLHQTAVTATTITILVFAPVC